MKNRFVSLVLISLVAGVGGFLLTPNLKLGVMKGEMTNIAIDETSYRIRVFYKEHHRFPRSLAELPQRVGYAVRIVDGWGRPLIYRQEGESAIVLLSLGRDRRPGGVGDDEDVQEKLSVKQPGDVELLAE